MCLQDNVVEDVVQDIVGYRICLTMMLAHAMSTKNRYIQTHIDIEVIYVIFRPRNNNSTGVFILRLGKHDIVYRVERLHNTRLAVYGFEKNGATFMLIEKRNRQQAVSPQVS